MDGRIDDRWLEWSVNQWIDGWIDSCLNGMMDEWIDGRIDELMDAHTDWWMKWWMNGWMDGRTDELIDESMDRWTDDKSLDWWMNRWTGWSDILIDGRLTDWRVGDIRRNNGWMTCAGGGGADVVDNVGIGLWVTECLLQLSNSLLQQLHLLCRHLLRQGRRRRLSSFACLRSAETSQPG